MDKKAKIIIIIIISGAILFFGFHRIRIWNRTKIEKTVNTERAVCLEKIGELEEKISNLEEVVSQQKEALVPKEKLGDAFGEESPAVSSLKKNIPCLEMMYQITSFTTYLDSREYLTFYKIEEGTYNLFQKLIEKLSAHPPVVSYEMDDLFTLIRNVTHFYRVIGRKRIRLINDILKNESEIIESVMATFFAWFFNGTNCKTKLNAPPSLDILYKYAGFFLNTLGGRSYLLRRDSKVRVLTSYYSILVLDRANDETQNPYGIDFRPYIVFSFYDISSLKGLLYQKEYLAELKGLMEKYQM
ncbi:MAG TPA: hypothetical protein QF571_06175 [Desulfobacterales bacterium]|nr:hypothetical protein [Desulfobacterales bacterium]